MPGIHALPSCNKKAVDADGKHRHDGVLQAP